MQRIRQDLVTGRQPQSGSRRTRGHLPGFKWTLTAWSTWAWTNREVVLRWGGRHRRVSGNAAPCRLEKNKLGRFRALCTREPPAGRVQDETQISIYKKQREDPVLVTPVPGGIFKWGYLKTCCGIKQDHLAGFVLSSEGGLFILVSSGFH